MSKQSETNQLIDSLVQDLPNSSESASWPFRFMLSWVASFIFSAVITVFIARSWPEFARLPDNTMGIGFLVTAFLWLLAFATCARICYLYAMPFSRTQKMRALAALAALSLSIVIFSGETLSGFMSELPNEFAIDRGPCGILILATSVITGSLALFSMRRAAPASLSSSGAWTLAAAGCMSSFFMHLICRHENPAHVMLWHVLPIVLVMGLGTKLAVQILRE